MSELLNAMLIRMINTKERLAKIFFDNIKPDIRKSIERYDDGKNADKLEGEVKLLLRLLPSDICSQLIRELNVVQAEHLLTRVTEILEDPSTEFHYDNLCKCKNCEAQRNSLN